MSIRTRRSTRGSILVAALILTAVTASTVAAVLAFSSSMHKLTQRTVAMEKAATTAEAGIEQLFHYFVRPQDVPAGLAVQKAAMTAFQSSKVASDLIGGGTLTFIDAENGINADMLEFQDEDASDVTSRVIELEIMAPANSVVDGFAPSPPLTDFRLRSVAEVVTSTNDTIQRTALMDIGFNPPQLLSVPAGLIAGGTAASNGHFNLHWGGGWSIGNILLKANIKFNKAGTQWTTSGDNTGNRSDGDTWVNYQSAQGFVCDDKGNPIYNDASVYAPGLTNTDGKYFPDALYQKVDNHTPAGKKTLTEKINAVIDRFAMTGDTTTGYEFWKNVAIAKDTYYRQGADGKVYNVKGQKIYDSAAAAMTAYRAKADAYVAFFDTKDGLPPKADKSNWIDLKFTGSIANQSKGLLYFCGNLDWGGSGNPPSTPIKNPNEVINGLSASTTQNVFHNGVMFVWGKLVHQGNGVIYGSVVVKGDYDGGGTPNIYYNEALRNGTPQNLDTAPIPRLRQL